MTGLALNSRSRDGIEIREWTARLGAVALGWSLFLAAGGISLRHEIPQADLTQISLFDPPQERPQEQPPQTPKRAPPRIAQQVQPTSPVTPSPAPSAVEIPNLPEAPAAKVIPAPPPEPLRSNSGAEGRFAQEVRNRIEQNKTYPSVAKNLGMTGSVEVLYVLERSGAVLRAEVITSSGYPMLDQAALKAIRGASFNAMPEDAWVGDRQKEFRTKLVFSINY